MKGAAVVWIWLECPPKVPMMNQNGSIGKCLSFKRRRFCTSLQDWSFGISVVEWIFEGLSVLILIKVIFLKKYNHGCHMPKIFSNSLIHKGTRGYHCLSVDIKEPWIYLEWGANEMNEGCNVNSFQRARVIPPLKFELENDMFLSAIYSRKSCEIVWK